MEENIDDQKEWLDEQYVEMALERYEKIKSVVSKGKRSTPVTKRNLSPSYSTRWLTRTIIGQRPG